MMKIPQEIISKPCLIVLDYIKLSTGDLGEGDNDKRHQQLGEITTRIKEFASDTRVPILTALQANRLFMQSTTTAGVAGSDEIARYVDGIWVLDEKTENETSEDNNDYGQYAGNRKLFPLIGRSFGKFHNSDYICIDYQEHYSDMKEIAKRSTFRKARVKQQKKEKKQTKFKTINNISLPGDDDAVPFEP